MLKRKASSKLKGSTLTPGFRASETSFKADFYEDGGKLFCKFCKHTVDWKRRDSCVDHIASQKHKKAKLKHQNIPPKKKQCTLDSDKLKPSTSLEERCDFQRDFLRMMTTANIPLEKVNDMKPFFMKHCKQGGSLTSCINLRERYLPQVFEEHLAAVKEQLKGKSVSIIVDETTDDRDKSVLNVLAGNLDKLFLIDVVFMKECNQQTLAQAVLKSLTNVGIEYNDVCCFVTDNAAYCKAAFSNILKHVLPNCIHVGCMAHILNLVGEDLVKDAYFREVEIFVKDIKNAFKRQPARKRRFVEYLNEMTHPEGGKLPPEPCSTRWGTWFNAVSYHRTHLHAYKSFFTAEASDAENIRRIRLVLGSTESTDQLLLKMNFISESCPKIQHTLTKLEGNNPFAPLIYSMMNGLLTYLMRGCVKITFGDETDIGLTKLNRAQRNTAMDHFHDGFSRAFQKLSKYTDDNAAMDYYKLCRVFDPRQLATIDNDITKYAKLQNLNNPSEQLMEEWDIYIQAAKDQLPADFNLYKFWGAMDLRTPTLAGIAIEHIWRKTTSVDAERSFSLYKHLLDDRRMRLTEVHTKQLLLLYFNGDVEGRLQ